VANGVAPAAETCAGTVADTNVLATAGLTTASVTLTAKTTGAIGNTIDITSTVTPANITIFTPLAGGADAITAQAQSIDFTPVSPASHFVYQMTLDGALWYYAAGTGTTVSNIITTLQPLISTPAIGCVDNTTKITCTATTPGTAFSYSGAVIDKNNLYAAINTEYLDGEARTQYVLTASSYSPASWDAYTGALASAIAVEGSGTMLQPSVDNAIVAINTAKSNLTLDTHGAIVNATGSFISLTGAVDLSGLDIGGIYELMSGSTAVSAAPLVAIAATGQLSLNPAYFQDFHDYNLTLSGTLSGSTNSNLDSRPFFIGPINYETLYDSIGSALETEGIYNNFSSITNVSVEAFSDLYFEAHSGSTILGRIAFMNPLNLTDSGTVTLLQNLGSVFSMSNGHIAFNPGSNPILNTGATLQMYFTGSAVPSLNMVSALDHITARDGSGNLMPDALS